MAPALAFAQLCPTERSTPPTAELRPVQAGRVGAQWAARREALARDREQLEAARQTVARSSLACTLACQAAAQASRLTGYAGGTDVIRIASTSGSTAADLAITGLATAPGSQR